MSLHDMSTRELFMEAGDLALVGAITKHVEDQRSYASAMLQIGRVLVARLALEDEGEA